MAPGLKSRTAFSQHTVVPPSSVSAALHAPGAQHASRDRDNLAVRVYAEWPLGQQDTQAVLLSIRSEDHSTVCGASDRGLTPDSSAVPYERVLATRTRVVPITQPGWSRQLTGRLPLRQEQHKLRTGAGPLPVRTTCTS